MKSNKGFTLLELLICVTMVSVVVVFLFRLISDVQSEQKNTPYISEIYAMRNEIMNKIGKVTTKYGVCASSTTGSTSEEAIVNLSICNGKSMVLTVTTKSFVIEYDGNREVYKIDDENIWIDPVFEESNDVFQNYEYYSIKFNTHKKGLEDTLLDDIAIFYGFVRNDSSPVISTSIDCNYSSGNGCLITIPKTGTYHLQLWGGKGGDNYHNPSGSLVAGGLGGYAYGELKLEAGQTIYAGLSVGGHTDYEEHYGYTADGGAGVFLAYNKVGSGYLHEYGSDKGQVIIVAGGGGGGSGCYDANANYGDKAAWYETARGKDAHAGQYENTFGRGGQCSDSDAFWCGGMGGGGWKGGWSKMESFYACFSGWGMNRRGGYGGQSYLNTNVIQNGVMYTSNPDYENSSINERTVYTSCSGYAQKNCMNSGGPYVRLSIATQQ